MKRLTTLLALGLMVCSFSVAEAKTKKSKKKPPTATVEQPLTAVSELEDAPQPKRERKQADVEKPPVVARPAPIQSGPPVQLRLTRADSRRFDLRSLPHTRPTQQERNEPPEPAHNPAIIDAGPPSVTSSALPRTMRPAPTAPAPPPLHVFEGLDRLNWGAGSPPDTNGDVGPNYYIQTVNTSIGVFNKSDGTPAAEFTFNTFMSQGHFGNLCDTNNFGDPVVLYDSFEDRWVITDFAFLTDVNGNVLAPSYQCFAVSMNGDPVGGGWNFYSIQISDFLNDYPKFGIWTDGLYMTANMFGFGAGGTFKTARVWAFNKAQMYAGSPTVKVVTFDVGGGDFTILPSNARLQTGTPPAGRPNLFMSTQLFLNAVTVYKFHVDWDHISLSTFTGPDTPISATSWPSFAAAVPQPGTTQTLDSLSNRAMMQNQYTNFGGTESLWVSHTVRRQNTSGFGAPRWYQVNVTGGTVATPILQATTWDPDGANVVHRWMPSLALDRAGNLAMGYSVSSSTVFPSMMYAGRLAGDTVNTFSQGEQTFFTGTASQLSSNRWGDYSAMTLDPDGCTFWFTTEYATGLDTPPVPPATVSPGFNQRWKTKFGNITPFSGCTPVGGGGTISGQVTTNPGGNPIVGAAVQLGSRSTTTDGSGNYSFNVPAGTYPSESASKAGFGPASASSIVVTDGNTTTQNFSLTAAPPSACFTDTTQADFQTGVPTNVDLNASPGDAVLANPSPVDQQNTTVSSSGAAFTNTAWFGQTFTPSVTGKAMRVDMDLFCFSCSGAPPNLVVSIRAASGNLPTGADLASGTVAFSTSGAGGFFSVPMTSPPTLTAGTQYAIVVRMAAAYATGTPAFLVSSTANPYAGGRLVNSTDSGSTWGVGTVSGVNLTNRDSGFKVYMNSGFSPSGTFVSGPKDASPSGGITPIWSTFSWNTTTPANTSIKFQLAGSNNVNGPFNFVGPDGTPATFFTTSPVQLSPQFYNLRYLEYEALLATTDATVTPALNDATLCFNDVDCSTTQATITPTPAQVCSNSTGNTASGPGGMTSYAWGITNGTITSATNTQSITYTAGASGAVTLTLTVTAPNGCIVSGSTPVTINPIPPTPTITPGGPTTFTYPNTVTLTSSSASGNQWYVGSSPIGGATNQSYVASASGDYTVGVTLSGCSSAQSSITTVVVNKATPTVTATGGTFVYNGTPQVGSGSATGGAGESLTVTLTYTGTGSTTYGPSATAPTLVGTYNVVAHTDGDANNNAGDSAPAALTITMANPTVTATGGTFTYDGNPKAGSGSATGGGGEVLAVTLTYNGTGSTTYGPSSTAPSLAGTYTVTAHTAGDANNNPGDSAATALTINKFNTLMAAHGGTVTYDGNPHAGTGQAFGGAGELLPVTLTYQGISGTTYGPSATPPTNVGVYLVTAHTVGDANNNAEDSLPNALRINKASPTMTVTAGTFTYDGTPKGGGSATGGGGEVLAVTVTFNGTGATTYGPTSTAPHLAGTYTVTVHTDGDANNNPGDAGPTALTINKFNTLMAAHGGTFTYNGLPEAGSGQAFGGAGELLPVTLTYQGISGTTYGPSATPPTNFGVYLVTAHTVGDANNNAEDSLPNALRINRATATIVVTAYCVDFDGAAHTAAGTATGVLSEALAGLNLTGTTHTAAGTYAGDAWTFTDVTGNYNNANGTVNDSIVNAVISAPPSTITGSAGNIASVPNAGAGTTYNWSITNGSITAGTGTNSINFTAGAIGTLTLQITVTTSTGCGKTKSANVTVIPPLTITSVVPPAGLVTGGKSVTINGTTFVSGATVTFGGVAATNVVFVNSTKLTAKTPAHAGGAVNVTVTNPDTSSSTLTNGYTYVPVQFDANGDHITNAADIFYLINFLFLGGPPPAGAAGLDSGDANGDGVVDSADIFYLIAYIYLHGPAPMAEPGGVSAQAIGQPFTGSVTLGEPVRAGGKLVVPVTVSTPQGAEAAQALSLRVVFKGGAGNATIRRANAARDLQPAFEASRQSADALSYLVMFDRPIAGTVAEIELDAPAGASVSIDVDPSVTLLSNGSGTRKATVAAGTLQVSGTSSDAAPARPERKE